MNSLTKQEVKNVIDGDTEFIEEMYAKFPSPDMIETLSYDTPDQSKYVIFQCILAGFEVQQTIPFGTPEEVRKEVRYLIDTFDRPDGRFMLTMGNGYTEDWKLESLVALYDEIATYPSSRHIQE